MEKLAMMKTKKQLLFGTVVIIINLCSPFSLFAPAIKDHGGFRFGIAREKFGKALASAYDALHLIPLENHADYRIVEQNLIKIKNAYDTLEVIDTLQEGMDKAQEAYDLILLTEMRGTVDKDAKKAFEKISKLTTVIAENQRALEEKPAKEILFATIEECTGKIREVVYKYPFGKEFFYHENNNLLESPREKLSFKMPKDTSELIQYLYKETPYLADDENYAIAKDGLRALFDNDIQQKRMIKAQTDLKQARKEFEAINSKLGESPLGTNEKLLKQLDLVTTCIAENEKILQELPSQEELSENQKKYTWTVTEVLCKYPALIKGITNAKARDRAKAQKALAQLKQSYGTE